MSARNHSSRKEVYVQRTETRCNNGGEGDEVAKVQKYIRDERISGDSRHSAKLDQRFCRDSRSIDKIDKSDKERVHLGRKTEISNGEDKEEGIDL